MQLSAVSLTEEDGGARALPGCAPPGQTHSAPCSGSWEVKQTPWAEQEGDRG
jgi:hypothetical protein